MLRRGHFFVFFLLVVSGITVFSISVYAEQEYDIPSWVKGVANFWAEGNITDNEFGEAITFLIEQGILKVQMPNTADTSTLNAKIKQLESEKSKLQSEIKTLKAQNSKLQNELSSLQKSSDPQIKSQSGFSGLVCKKDAIGMVQLTGKYTNGDRAYSFLSITLAIIGNNGEVLDTGIGIISNIAAHETKIFTASSTYTGNYKSCEVQVDAGY